MNGRVPIRVLHLRDSPWVDGPGRTILETAARIDRARIDYQVGVFVPAAGVSHPLIEALRRRRLPVHAIVDDGSSLAGVVNCVVELMGRLGTEILHSSELRSNLVALRCRRLRPSTRLVSTAHGWIANDIRGRIKNVLDRLLLRRFDRVVLVSHAMRRRLPGWWVPDARVQVLHNALMLESYGSEVRTSSRREPAAGQTIELLTVGRLSAEKAHDVLFRALARLSQSFPAIRLTVAGTGPEEPGLRQLAEQLDIANKVNFIGYIDDMPALYARSDLVIQSSLTEGLPNVMLESAYLGVPVVATDVGGTREVIEHAVNGWLVRPGSVRALVAGIQRYLDGPAEFVAMARSGRRRIEEGFSIDVRTAKQAEVYEGLGARNT